VGQGYVIWMRRPRRGYPGGRRSRDDRGGAIEAVGDEGERRGRALTLIAEAYIIADVQGGCVPHLLRLRRSWSVVSDADVAQLAEQLICNQQVAGSSPIVGSS
jgi:hypothetical protein